MNKRSNAFAPMDTGSPPPMDFTFTNAGQSRGTPAHRDYFSDNQADRSKYIQKLEESDELVSPNSPTPYGQMPPKKLKPGPISRSDLSSSSTNVFKLRAESAPSAQKPATSARLRQEVFKKPHTLAPSFSNLDTATAARFAPSPGLSTGGDAMLKVSNRQMKHVYADSSGASPAPSPFLKSGAEAISDAIRTPGRINTGQRRKSSVHGKSSSLLLSAVEPTPRAPDVVQPEDYLPRATEFPPALVDLPRTETRYQTPARDGAIPTTPSSGKSIREDTGSMHDLRRKCEIYEVDQKFDRDAIASQRQVIEELSSENARIELKTRDLESKYATEVKEITQRADASMAKLTDLHENFSKSSASQIKELKQGLENFRHEVRDAMSATESLLAGYTEMRNTLKEVTEEHEQQMVEHSDEKTRLQQTNDLLRDQLTDRTGNYTESLEREKELQKSLLVLGESHANVAKSLSTLHEQHGQINTKYADSRLAESLARKRVEELEEISTRLKIDNAGMKSLLASNEQAFSRKLQALEEDIDTMRTGLEGAHKELSASKIGEQDARSQVQALLREKEDILKNNVTLERDLALSIQSLEEARARNQALEQQLNDEKRSLEEARTEGYQSMGRLAEKDQSTSAQIQALNTALESHREREGSLIGEIATLNALVSTLRERAKEADEAEAEYRALEKALSKKHVEMGRVEVENSQLQSQVVQLELARDAINEEIRQLRENGCVARERETAAQKELQELRRSLKEHHDAGEKASVKIARMEGEVEQLKAALENEKDAHRVAEKQRETALLSLSKIQAEQKSVLDKASATEKKLRSSTDGSQERIKLEIECEERENELKRLRYELNASNTGKATLESLVSEFKNSVQQARSQREKIEAQEGKLATLSNQVSTQETELRLLEHQLANANARLAESRADTDAHRAAAESARASAALIEGQLKRKEQDIEAIRSELQSRQLPQTDTTADAGSTSVLQNKIEEKEGAIKNLKSQVLELEKSSETIVERYKDGKLTNREKDLVGVITAGIVQEKNRTINNLKGELKRKENEIETHKITVANLKDSLAKQIKQTIDLKEQLEPNGPKDPAGRQPFSDKNMTVSSSPLSDRSQAPDHDPPAPDSPAVHLTERPMQNSRAHDQVQQYNPGQPTRAKPPARTLAPIRLESGNATDEIQDFEEPKTPQDAASTGRKRGIVNIEPLADGNQEEAEHETQRKTRAKKDNKLAGEGNGSKGQSNKADGTSTTKGKAAKRRKF